MKNASDAVDVHLDVAHPRFGRLQLPHRHGACTLRAREHPVVAVVRGEELRAHGLVIRGCRQHGLWLGVNQDGPGR